LLFSVLLLGSVNACGGDGPPPATAKKEATAAWADVFEGTPELYAVIRPKALKRDGVYGEFFKALMRVAQARGLAHGDTMVQAAEGADEIIVGLTKGNDAALVFRGVPASLDPQKITDAEGHPLFRPMSDRSKVVEYELLDRKHAEAGALFVLPDRSWVGTLGDARTRARQVFASPTNRPAPQVDPDALVAVRVAGPLTHALDRSPSFAVLSKKLSSVSFSLKPGKAGLVIGLAYPDPDATAWAEMHAKRLVDELSRDEKRAWLKDAKVAYEGNTVFIRVAVPPRLLEELPSASGASLGL
jgi:hypothetical protein